MVYFKEWAVQAVEGAGTVRRICENCSNEADHVLATQPGGVAVGLPWAKKPCASTHRAYYLACPICGALNVKLSRDQARALMRKG